MSSLQSLFDYGLGDSDIEDSDEEIDKGGVSVLVTTSNIPVQQPRIVGASSRLVSYGEEDEEEEGRPHDMEVNQAFDSTIPAGITQEIFQQSEQQEADKKEQSDKNDGKIGLSELRLSNIKIQLPPEPTGRCSNSLQDKIIQLLEKKHRSNLDLNASVQKKKNFRNPSIYEKLVSYCNIQENGTNCPKSLFDPSAWAKEPSYDILAKQQKEANEKREKEKAKRTQIEFMTGTKKPTSVDDTKKRKSKWDISASGVNPASVTRTSTPPIPPGVGTIPGLAKVISDAAASAAKKAKIDN